MVVVLLILGVIAAATVPALGSLGEEWTSSESAGQEIAQLLSSSRRTALNHGVAVEAVLDPVRRAYWVEVEDVQGPSEDSPIDHVGKLDLQPEVRFVGESIPYRFRFDRLGSGHGPVIYLEDKSGSRATVSLASWTGEPLVETHVSAQE
jgi:hypothetical protein